MARSKKPLRPFGAVWAGSHARCPRGHRTVYLSTGQDARGKYLDATCREPSCSAQPERFRAEGT